MKMIKFVRIFFITASIISTTLGNEFWNDFRLTWGPTPDFGYERMPRNIIDAQKDGWVLNSATCENDGKFNGLRWTDPMDDAVGLLFDIEGHIAGLQSFTRHEDIMNPYNQYNYAGVPIFQNETLNGNDYLVITIYFIKPELICSTERIFKDNLGNNSEIYFQNGPTPLELRPVPKKRDEAITQGWSKNNCVPGMGWHNFYMVESFQDHNCTEVQPHCILFNEFDEMIGLCLNMQGLATSTRYEYPIPEAVQYVLGPEPPAQCVIDTTNNVGTTTLHIYFVNAPWEVGC